MMQHAYLPRTIASDRVDDTEPSVCTMEATRASALALASFTDLKRKPNYGLARLVYTSPTRPLAYHDTVVHCPPRICDPLGSGRVCVFCCPSH